jgi:hypothetical protein
MFSKAVGISVKKKHDTHEKIYWKQKQQENMKISLDT